MTRAVIITPYTQYSYATLKRGQLKKRHFRWHPHWSQIQTTWSDRGRWTQSWEWSESIRFYVMKDQRIPFYFHFLIQLAKLVTMSHSRALRWYNFTKKNMLKRRLLKTCNVLLSSSVLSKIWICQILTWQPFRSYWSSAIMCVGINKHLTLTFQLHISLQETLQFQGLVLQGQFYTRIHLLKILWT